MTYNLDFMDIKNAVAYVVLCNRKLMLCCDIECRFFYCFDMKKINEKVKRSCLIEERNDALHS